MLDSSIVATSLVSIAADFGTDPADAKLNWVALSYALTYLSCAVLFARASDVVGRRVAFGSAYVIFAVFSVACGFASNMEELIALRAIQGVGGAGKHLLFL
jgi:Arabinose efflux permease